MKKEKWRIVTGLILLSGLLFVSAGGRDTGSGSSGAAPIGTLPLTKDDVTFTVLIGGIGNQVTSYDYKDNAFTRRITDETGIKFDFIAVSNADMSARRNVLLNSGDYPEILPGLGVADLDYYAKEKILISLDEYKPLDYPNLKKAFEQYPAFNQILRASDGKLYGLPVANDCAHCIYNAGRAWYYMPFVRDSGRKMPETLDEYRDYLRFVKATDLNKNGIHDEIPAAFTKNDVRNVAAVIAKAYMPFVYTDSYYGLAMNGKQIAEQYKDNYFREALRYLNGLWKEGLILEDSFTLTTEQYQSIGEATVPILATSLGRYVDDFVIQDATTRWLEPRPLLPFIGPNGVRNAPNKEPWSILGCGWVITDKCKDPRLAIALYDYLLNFDVELDGYIGPKGQAWTDADPGSLGLDGKPAKYKLLTTYMNQGVNTSWDQQNPMIRDTVFRMGEQAVDAEKVLEWIRVGTPSLRESMAVNKSYNEMFNYNRTVPVMQFKMPDSVFIPPLIFSILDNDRLRDIRAVLDPYIDQAITEFVIGTRDINNNSAWNAYLADLDRLGAKERADIIQKYIK
jgi:putative aldouronate transport system substrate-binding protein